MAGKDERRRDYYLAKVTEAEQAAGASKNDEAREQWLEIADGYRLLLRRLNARMARMPKP